MRCKTALPTRPIIRGEVIGINANGDAGSQSALNNAYTYNGLPSNSLDITADGAHVSDPGCNCDTPVNPNSDFLQEFKVLQGNFSAENQKGPILITSVTKAGGQDFHGSLFFSARNYAMNANDALNNADLAPKPANEYYYPGASIGGPVIIPGTNFNKSRQKLFFFAGYEYFYQKLDTGLLRATVPTPGMLEGNFSSSELQKLGDPTNNYNTASGNPAASACAGTSVAAKNYLPCLNSTGLGWYPGGIIPAGDLNANMLALMKLYPAANADPAVTHGYNYVQSEVFNQNNQQFVTRGTITSATIPSCSCATTTSGRPSSFRWACGGATDRRCLIRRRYWARTGLNPYRGRSRTYLARR